MMLQPVRHEGARTPAAQRVCGSCVDHQAIYCKPCKMWLNGPTQQGPELKQLLGSWTDHVSDRWADHEIGKKHRKAVRRQQATLRHHNCVGPCFGRLRL